MSGPSPTTQVHRTGNVNSSFNLLGVFLDGFWSLMDTSTVSFNFQRKWTFHQSSQWTPNTDHSALKTQLNTKFCLHNLTQRISAGNTRAKGNKLQLCTMTQWKKLHCAQWSQFIESKVVHWWWTHNESYIEWWMSALHSHSGAFYFTQTVAELLNISSCLQVGQRKTIKHRIKRGTYWRTCFCRLILGCSVSNVGEYGVN